MGKEYHRRHSRGRVRGRRCGARAAHALSPPPPKAAKWWLSITHHFVTRYKHPWNPQKHKKKYVTDSDTNFVTKERCR